MLKIGLTGGIGSGKTRVADLLAEQGAAVIDTDVVAHQLTAVNGAAMPAIAKLFGEQVVATDGSLNRAYMRQLVFANPEQRQKLESLLHPMIATAVAHEASLAKGVYTVFVVPLLVETVRWLDKVDRICVVDCDVETQIARVKKRSGLSEVDIKSILRVQATREQRRAVAHDLIDNGFDTDSEGLVKQVLEMHQHWCNLSKYE